MMTEKLLDLLNKKELYRRSKEYASNSNSKISNAIEEILRQIDREINYVAGELKSKLNQVGT